MNSYGSLPYTGATVSLFGVVVDQTWLLGLGVGIVLLGAVLARFGFRRNKSPLDV